MHKYFSPDQAVTTGHPEIDKQHEELSQLIGGLESVCTLHEKTGESCQQCAQACQEACNDRLANLIADLLGFMVTHFAYEEKLMHHLPATAECIEHIAAHQLAHAEVSSRLSELTFKLDRDDPRQSSLRLQTIINGWIGGHSEAFDNALTETLEKAYAAEVNYDCELTKLLSK